jgi:hypothetical protein
MFQTSVCHGVWCAGCATESRDRRLHMTLLPVVRGIRSRTSTNHNKHRHDMRYKYIDATMWAPLSFYHTLLA